MAEQGERQISYLSREEGVVFLASSKEKLSNELGTGRLTKGLDGEVKDMVRGG